MKTEMAQYIKTVLQIDDQSLIDELIGDYVNLFTETFPKIQARYNEGNFPELRQLAHMLKGVSANIGAEKVRAIALQLQDASDAENGELCASLVSELEKCRGEIDS
ncbi:MAG: Hpt domain-containing protein [Planctomycetia bacterium]|nr:Hpt domain-containing protein [Planctomycetia bacterium]